MTTAAEGDPPFQLLLRLLELPDGFFQAEVLRRLGPAALASLAGAGQAWAEAVAATALMTWANHEKRFPTRCFSMFDYPATQLCLREACSLAARGGHLEVLKWLHNTGCPCDTYTCRAAASGGYLEVLNWLHNQGCPWDEWNVCHAAAAGGNLEVLTWLHNSGCAWGSATCTGAACGGHLTTLQWAREHHCAWNKAQVRDHAARGRHVDMLRWLDEHGGP